MQLPDRVRLYAQRMAEQEPDLYGPSWGGLPSIPVSDRPGHIWPLCRICPWGEHEDPCGFIWDSGPWETCRCERTPGHEGPHHCLCGRELTSLD
jgi:hypothetical protein